MTVLQRHSQAERDEFSRQLRPTSAGANGSSAYRMPGSPAANNHGWDEIMAKAAPHRFAAQAKRPAHG